MARHENKLIINYIGMNPMYKNSKVMCIAGRENSGPDDLGTIVAPMPARDVEIDPNVPDPVLFSYANTKGGKARLRVVLVKIWSKAGCDSSCKVSVYVPSVDGDWISKTEDVTLLYADGSPVRNPHGMADVGDKICFIDYESQKIASVTEDALESAGDGTSLTAETLDLADDLDNDPNARGQAIIALGDYVYALYISADTQATTFEASQLLRLSVSSEGTLSYSAKTFVGKNAQSIIPVLYDDGNGAVVWLLIPAIGGPQLFTGATSGTDSNICVVQAIGAWPEAAEIKVTADPMPAPQPDDPTPSPIDGNIIAVGAGMRGNASKLFILTQVYMSYGEASWMLYGATVCGFMAIEGTPTLSEAASIQLVDEGIVEANYSNGTVPTPYSVYFWDLVYEQSHREDEDEDRLWIALGAPLLVTKPNRYSSPNKPNGPFIVYYCIGGGNVNSLDIPIETMHQSLRKVSLKRGMRGARVGVGRIGR